MSIRYIMSEDTRNQFDQTREIITTLFELSCHAEGKCMFDGNALAGTFDLIKTQLDDIASQIYQASGGKHAICVANGKPPFRKAGLSSSGRSC